MAVWLIRAGSHGEYEQKYLQEKRVYVTWSNLDVDLSKLSSRDSLVTEMTQRYGDVKAKAIENWSRQVWPFAHDMKPGDWVVLPSKSSPFIHIGEITSDYIFNQAGPSPYFHFREVNWFAPEIPRTNFSQDLLYSFGAFLTICRIQRNDAELRLREMAKNGWRPEKMSALIKTKSESKVDSVIEDSLEETDIEQLAKDQIVRLIEAKFKGHNFTRLVEAVLNAQGYTTLLSEEGPDGGADILAGSGPMGFGEQRICVEVKSGTTLIDRPTVDKLLGAMTKFNASQGLFVAWGDFKSNVQKELASSFFRLRLWGKEQFLDQLFAVYDKLDAEIKAELPLKQVWMVTPQDDV